MTPDRGVDPRVSLGTGDAFVVKGACDQARTDASGEIPEDLFDYDGLGQLDLPVTPDRLAMGVELADDLVP